MLYQARTVESCKVLKRPAVYISYRRVSTIAYKMSKEEFLNGTEADFHYPLIRYYRRQVYFRLEEQSGLNMCDMELNQRY